MRPWVLVTFACLLIFAEPASAADVTFDGGGMTIKGVARNIGARLQTLRSEFAFGTQRLDVLDAERTQLTEQLLRIAGAIQVLEELSAEQGDTREPNGAPASESAAGLQP
jgi:hypothetical protein